MIPGNRPEDIRLERFIDGNIDLLSDIVERILPAPRLRSEGPPTTREQMITATQIAEACIAIVAAELKKG